MTIEWDREMANWQADFTASITTEEMVRVFDQAAKQSRSQYSLVASVAPPPPPTRVEVAEALEKAADLIESGTLAWIQGRELSRDDGGQVVGACAIGLIAYICDEKVGAFRHYTPLYGAVVQVVEDRLGMPIPTWNDSMYRTRIEVIELFKSIAKDLRNENG